MIFTTYIIQLNWLLLIRVEMFYFFLILNPAKSWTDTLAVGGGQGITPCPHSFFY